MMLLAYGMRYRANNEGHGVIKRIAEFVRKE